MAKRKFAPFGTSPVDHLVKAFLEGKGIDPREISGYTITRSVDDIGTITVSMPFEEEPTPVAQDDSPDASCIPKYMVGEHGPELTVPETDKEV